MRLHTIDVAYLPEDVPNLPDRLMPFMGYFLRQAWPQLLFMTIIMLASSSMEAVQYYFIKVMVDAFATAKDLHQLKDILLWPMIVFTILCLILQPIFARYGQWLLANIRPAFNNMVRRQLARYMHNHSYGYFQEDFAGRLSSKVIETPSAISTILETIVGPVGFALMTFITSLVLFAQSYWVFAALSLVWIVTYGILLRLYIPHIHKASKNSYEQVSIIRGRFVDTLTNVLTVKLFARKQHEDRYLLEALDDASERGQKLMHTVNGMQVWLEVISVLFIAGAFATCIYGWIDHKVTAGDVAMALPLAMRLMNMSWWMSQVCTGLFESLGQVQEGMETITVRHTVTDRPNADDLRVTKGEITFRGVRFAYGERPVFEHLDLVIPPGQKVGLIGPSGAGKSTLVQILLRLYDVQGGRIEIDGQAIEDVRQDSLRSCIAVIPQATDMMHRSIRDNILYGRLDASEDEMIEAARRAYADEFIGDLRDKKDRIGYDAFAGERGVKLSGGQRQRVAIARAILKDAPILVLDEATSALDSESEKLIQASLGDAMRGKTVLAIAHRLSTIAHMDRLIVLDKGRIVEDGNHGELLAKGGLYARLWNLQSGGFLRENLFKQ